MKRAGLVVAVTALCLSLLPVPATHAQSNVDFTRFVGVGDSLTAGFKDGALFAEGQSGAFYVHVAESMNTQIVMPLIASPGIPTPNPQTGSGRLIQIPGTCQVGAFTLATGVTTGRLDPTAAATDVAIPGQNLDEALNSKWAIDPANIPGTLDTAEDFVLGFPYVLAPPPFNTPRSQVETAVGLQPTFLSVWLGSNDALAAALAATVNDQTLTPVSDFNARADQIFAALASTGAEGVVLNVPDVTVIAHLFSSADLQALTGLDAAQVNLLFGVSRTSFVPLSALPTIQAIAGGQATGPLPANLILTKKEIKKIRKNIKKYNKKLETLANANGWAYVDVNAILNDYDKNGVVVPGVGTLTTAYLGGIFSLDGIHPTATGHALVAGTVVDAINAKYGTSLPRPDVAAVAATDPQVCMTGSAKALTLDDVVKYLPAALSAREVILNRGRQ